MEVEKDDKGRQVLRVEREESRRRKKVSEKKLFLMRGHDGERNGRERKEKDRKTQLMTMTSSSLMAINHNLTYNKKISK